MSNCLDEEDTQRDWSLSNRRNKANVCNTSTIKLSKNPVIHGRSKHIRKHFGSCMKNFVCRVFSNFELILDTEE